MKMGTCIFCLKEWVSLICWDNDGNGYCQECYDNDKIVTNVDELLQAERDDLEEE